ncbi:MAG: hypothetical protein OXJ64_08270 [Boseongicola sp.]|nr:hypothetical protein [Boseongicola sp.]
MDDLQRIESSIGLEADLPADFPEQRQANLSGNGGRQQRAPIRRASAPAVAEKMS